MTSPPPRFSRRGVLLGAAMTAFVGLPAAACRASSPPSPDVDGLTAALARARADSELAATASRSAPAAVGPALDAVAAERSAHARALSAQLVRITGTDTSQTTPTTQTTPTSTTPAPAHTTDDVVAALRESAAGAAGSAAVMSGSAAGLLGSIAAACTAAHTVALAPSEAPQ